MYPVRPHRGRVNLALSSCIHWVTWSGQASVPRAHGVAPLSTLRLDSVGAGHGRYPGMSVPSDAERPREQLPTDDENAHLGRQG